MKKIKVTRIIRTCLKAGYFGALRSKILKRADLRSIKAQNAANAAALASILTKGERKSAFLKQGSDYSCHLRFLCAVLAVMLLLTACSKSDPSVLSLDTLFYRTESSLAEGHLFFAGKVVSAAQQNRAITYYESETEVNTFYQVEVTEDFFGCLPERTLTVCVMGTDAHFVSRTELQSGAEYLFDVNTWAGEDEMLFLLPTFYEALPQREGEYIYYTKAETRYAVEGDYTAYKQTLFAMAEEQGYAPAAAWSAIRTNLQAAAERDAAYFKELKFEAIDKEAIGQITAFAADRLKQIKTAPKTWAEIQEVLK